MTDQQLLLPPALRALIPPLYAGEARADPIVHAKLFTPWTSWTWFITEFDGDDTLFGLVNGHEVELGYVSLKELESITGPAGLKVERDAQFKPKPLSEVRLEVARMRGDVREGVGYDDGRAQTFNGIAGLPAAPGQERAPPRYPSPNRDPGIQILETQLAPSGRTQGAPKVATPRDAAIVLHDLIGAADREHFVALYLNGRHVITHAHIVSRGTTQSAMVHPREVFKAAFLANASAVIVGHNHPSGDVAPSAEDGAVYERLQDVGKTLGVPVIDSLVVGPQLEFYSASTGAELVLPSRPSTASRCADAGGGAARAQGMEEACRGLLQDLYEVLERQGEAWWDETVTAGTHHRQAAERFLGLEPYERLPDAAESAPEPE